MNEEKEKKLSRKASRICITAVEDQGSAYSLFARDVPTSLELAKTKYERTRLCAGRHQKAPREEAADDGVVVLRPQNTSDDGLSLGTGNASSTEVNVKSVYAASL